MYVCLYVCMCIYIYICEYLEIRNRLAMITRTCCQLKPFWNKANTSTTWKLQVFNAIIKTGLMYGRETMQLTHNEMGKIDAFQNNIN